MRIFFLILSFLSASPLMAAITVTAVNGASQPVNLTPSTTTTGTTTVTTTNIKIFGGVAGQEACGSGTNPVQSNGFCDSCLLAPTSLECNHNQINGSMELQISLRSDNSSGTMEIRDTTNAATAIESVAYSAGQEVTLNVRWDDICSKSPTNLGTNCEAIRARSSASFSATFNVGVNTDGDSDIDDIKQITISVANIPAPVSSAGVGIQDFSLYPGDQKAYVESLDLASDSFPGANAKAIIFYYKPSTNPAQAPGTTSACADVTGLTYQSAFIENELIEQNNERDIESDALADVLENGTLYAFRAAVMDEAGNIGLFSDPAGCVEYKQTVLPQQVNGLLSDTSSCFIATAAYGSSYEPHVRMIRLFRDQYLAQTHLGRDLVNFYYQHSPRVADFIRNHEVLKATTRVALTPVWAMSYSMVHFGPWITLLLSFMFVGGCIGIFVGGRKLVKK